MIANVRQYRGARDSGVSWLGEVPDHWHVMPGRACYRERCIPNIGMRESQVLSLSFGRIVVKPKDKLHGLVPESFETYQIIEPGDIVVRPTDLQNDWNSLRFALSPHRGIITSAYICLRTQGEMTREYGYLLLHAYDLKKIFYGLGSGLRQNLDWRDFKYLPCLVPPAAEQSAIVRFLDHADRRIGRAIRAKQKLIALLNEQKQAVIHRAVTRGLDPNVRLKPSGVDWLGDVPEHWAVKPLKHLVPQVTVGIVVQPSRLYEDAGVPCLRSLNISTGVIKPAPMVYISEASNRQQRKSQVFSDDIVVVRTGRAGVAAIVTPEFDGANCIDLLIVRKSGRILSEYLLTYLNSWGAQADVEYRSVGAIQAHYNTGTLANLVVPVPPLDEQEAILAELDLELRTIHRSQKTANDEIRLLREYRTRLIADVVTGKLDVRTASPALVEA
jgi:type I restriction enzyme, S subunit